MAVEERDEEVGNGPDARGLARVFVGDEEEIAAAEAERGDADQGGLAIAEQAGDRAEAEAGGRGADQRLGIVPSCRS